MEKENLDYLVTGEEKVWLNHCKNQKDHQGKWRWESLKNLSEGEMESLKAKFLKSNQKNISLSDIGLNPHLILPKKCKLA